jgi:hypothetical protein
MPEKAVRVGEEALVDLIVERAVGKMERVVGEGERVSPPHIPKGWRVRSRLRLKRTSTGQLLSASACPAAGTMARNRRERRSKWWEGRRRRPAAWSDWKWRPAPTHKDIRIGSRRRATTGKSETWAINAPYSVET